MKNNLFYILTFLCLCCSCSNKELNTPEIQNVLYISDIKENYDINSVSFNDAKPLKNSKIGHQSGIYWFQFKIKSNGEPIVLNLEENTSNLIEIYQNKQLIANLNDNLERCNTGLIIQKPTSQNYLLKVRFKKQAFFPIRIKTVDRYYNDLQITNLINGLYYGIVLVVFIVNIFFYFSLKESSFLNYSLFLIAINIGISEYDGVIKLWASPQLIYYLDPAIHFLVPLTLVIFISKFLKHHILMPKTKIVAGIILSAICFFYSIYIITGNFYYFAIGDNLDLLLFMVYMGLGIYETRRQVYAKFTVIGYSLMLLMSTTYIIPMNWGIHFYDLSIDVIKLGALFETFILTYAITYRVKVLNNENRERKREISKYTVEIKQLEQTLKDQSEVKTTSFEDKIEQFKTQYHFTNREIEVLKYLVQDYTNTKMAKELFVSLNTIKYHTKNIYKKLNVKNKKEVKSIFSDS